MAPAVLGRAHPLVPLPSQPASIGREPEEGPRSYARVRTLTPSHAAGERGGGARGTLRGGMTLQPNWRSRRPEPTWTYRK